MQIESGRLIDGQEAELDEFEVPLNSELQSSSTPGRFEADEVHKKFAGTTALPGWRGTDCDNS